MGALIAPTPGEVVVPTSRDMVLALDSPTLYLLEQAGEIAREILDDRIVAWTEQGWTVRRIAEEIGCSKTEANRRQMGLGVQSTDPRGGNRTLSQPGTNSLGPDNSEVVDAEVVPDDLGSQHPEPKRKPRQPKSEAQLVDYLPDLMPDAGREGAFRQAVVAWCEQEHTIWSEIENNHTPLVPKSEYDREALLAALAHIHRTATRLERRLKNGQ